MPDGYYRTLTSEVEANRAALEKALTALRKIKDNDPGYAHTVAADALDNITYFDADGTMRNGDGSRNIFDDVDK